LVDEHFISSVCSGADYAAAPAAAAVEVSSVLRPVIELTHEWLDLQKQIKREEIAHLEANLTLLKRNFAKLKTSKDGVVAQLETFLVKESSVEEKDEVRKQVETLQGLRSSIAEMMRSTHEFFHREFHRLIELKVDTNCLEQEGPY
jgi:hypothetical protein